MDSFAPKRSLEMEESSSFWSFEAGSRSVISESYGVDLGSVRLVCLVNPGSSSFFSGVT